MPNLSKRLAAPALMLSFALASCAQARAEGVHPNAIQPETTLTITAEAVVDREPDIAFLNAGVETEGETAAAAISENAERMTGVFDALAQAGVDPKDMQTSNFALEPRYNYNRDGRPPELLGYKARNQLTVKVRDLDNLGRTMDAMVSAGGNTFSGLTFALDDDTAVRNEARRLAMQDALSRAELYADAAGLEVGRIVTINESGYARGPQPLAMARGGFAAESAATPIAAGEVGYTASVTVVFELD
ncbi:MAG: SIMPL domain-containing protein [Pseudomonadota bacterium]